MPGTYRGPIQLVVLDFAGTLVDGPQDLRDQYPEDDGLGVKAPIIAFTETLREWGIDLSWEQLREPMGRYKRDHLRVLLESAEGRRQFEHEHDREWNEGDIDEMMEVFRSVQEEVIVREELAKPITGAKETIDTLQRHGKALANTTGYTEAAAEALDAKLREEYDIHLDFVTHSDNVKAGRPAPWMIQQGMRALDVERADAVVKVGDTTLDIEEGVNAGVWTVGLYSSGNDDFDALRDAGADYLVPSISELPQVIWSIEQRLLRGDQ